MKYKLGMLICAFLMLLTCIVYSILQLLFLVFLLIPLLFFKFDRFSRILGKLTKNIETDENNTYGR